MKNRFFLLLSFSLWACTDSGLYGPKIKAKLIRVTCASTVIQVLDSGFYSLGETWPIHGTFDTIEHAAYVINKCEFSSDLSEGNEFYFRQVRPSSVKNNCVVCAMYDYPPGKGIYLRVVK